VTKRNKDRSRENRRDEAIEQNTVSVDRKNPWLDRIMLKPALNITPLQDASMVNVNEMNRRMSAKSLASNENAMHLMIGI